MIVSTLSFGMHILVSSFRFLRPVGKVLELLQPAFRNMSIKAVSLNVNTKHLKRGDPLPPYNGKLRVYNNRYCPFAQRTILALNAKGVDYEVVNINLIDKPDWIATKSALSKVPALEIAENVSLIESLITVEYLEDVYPKRSLFPKDPVKKAFDKIIIEMCSPVVSLFVKVAKSPDSITEDGIRKYHETLAYVEEQLKNRGTKFLDGDQPGYGDYMIWPFFERIWLLRDYEERLRFDTSKLKRLSQWIEDMLKDPAVSQYLIPCDVMVKLIEGYRTGDVNYDLLLEK